MDSRLKRRALGQAIVMTPISAIALVGIAQTEAGAASGLFNMMRNLGGAIGTAAVETFFSKREQCATAALDPRRTNCSPPMVGGHVRARTAAASANGAPLASQWIGRLHWARAAPRRKDRPPQAR